MKRLAMVSALFVLSACALSNADEESGETSSEIRDAKGNEVIDATVSTVLKTSAADSTELPESNKCQIDKGAKITIASPVESGKHVRGRLVSAPGCSGKFAAGLEVYLFRSHFSGWSAAAPHTDGAGANCAADSSLRPNFLKPLNGVVTSRFGDCRDGCSRSHAGIDIAASAGTIIVAAEDGVVIDDRTGQGGCGTVLEIQHPNGSSTRLCHNQGLFVKKGQCVSRGQAVARVGNTGIGTGPHMHLEYYPTTAGGAVNPAAVFGY